MDEAKEAAAARAKELGHVPEEPWGYGTDKFAGTFCERCNALLYAGVTARGGVTWGGKVVEEPCPEQTSEGR